MSERTKSLAEKADNPYVILFSGSLAAAMPVTIGINLLANPTAPIDNVYGGVAIAFGLFLVMAGAASAALGAVRRGYVRI